MASTKLTYWKGLRGWAELKAFVKGRPTGWNRGAVALTGPSGIGKTTGAQMLAHEFGDERDNIWIDAGRLPSVEAIRGLEERLIYCKWGGAWRVVVIDEAHNLTKAAKRALLGMLERLPARTLIVFTSIEGSWLDFDRGAMRRRVFEFAAEGFSRGEILKVLRERVNGRIEDVGDDGLKAIARAASGNLGQALIDLEQVTMTGQLPLALRRRIG